MSTRRSKKNKKLGVIIKFSFFIYLFVGLFALVWLRTAVLNLEYTVGELQKEKESVIRERGLISAERASLYSVKKIEEVAIEGLGMRLPDRERVFIVKKTPATAPYDASIRSVSETTTLKNHRKNENEKK